MLGNLCRVVFLADALGGLAPRGFIAVHQREARLRPLSKTHEEISSAGPRGPPTSSRSIFSCRSTSNSAALDCESSAAGSGSGSGSRARADLWRRTCCR